MLGTILFVDEATGTGIIRADDGKRYRFPVAEWPEGSALAASVRVDFDADGDRALAPVPITEAVVSAVTTAPAPAVEPETVAEPVPVIDSPTAPHPEPLPPADLSAGEVTATADQESVEATPPAEPAISPALAPPPAPQPLSPGIPAADLADALPGRPVSMAHDAVPDYVGLSETDSTTGGRSGIFVIGGAILLLALAGLAYMMWDNAETAGTADVVAEDSGVSASFYAQEDLPVRNVAAMTNATVLGRIARGDRVTGVEVDGSADGTSRWLRLDGGNRFVPMTGLGPNPPANLPAVPIAPVPVVPPVGPDDGSFERTFGGQGGDYRADRNGPVDAVPPTPNRPAPPIRPTPQPRPAPPVRPNRPPDRPVTPSRPQDTRPVGPQRDVPQRAAPQRNDPRETSPVGR